MSCLSKSTSSYLSKCTSSLQHKPCLEEAVLLGIMARMCNGCRALGSGASHFLMAVHAWAGCWAGRSQVQSPSPCLLQLMSRFHEHGSMSMVPFVNFLKMKMFVQSTILSLIV